MHLLEAPAFGVYWKDPSDVLERTTEYFFETDPSLIVAVHPEEPPQVVTAKLPAVLEQVSVLVVPAASDTEAITRLSAMAMIPEVFIIYSL